MEIIENARRWRKFTWIQAEVQGKKLSHNKLLIFSVEVIKVKIFILFDAIKIGILTLSYR